MAEGRTALVFPIYNEDVTKVFPAVEATFQSVRHLPHTFEIFILSDTTQPDVALAEEEAFLALRNRVGNASTVFYRRRTINEFRKSGNIHDFVSRWGGRYDHFVVYDADSVMETDTLTALVSRMQANPKAGLIQTVPRLVGARSLFARIHQFAAALYGPVLGTGVAWWSQEEGNFWGHNAIIRTKAFAESAGLPILPGRPPLGGPILSHDFVEAALLRRAGWQVIVAADLDGSFEECPPTIIDLVARDRRWCQGNLQHIAVLMRTRGLAWTSRLHLASGIASYLASPFWLLFILVGMGLSLQNRFLKPDYFGNGETLFPQWPVIDPARALSLFGITMAILFAPKIFGLIIGLRNQDWREKVGGWAMVRCVGLEILISALVAPILMAAQTSAVVSILLGRDAGWTPQQRDAGGYAAKDVMRRHAVSMFLGVVLTVAAFAISPLFAAWLAPASLGLIFAGPISYWTGRARTGVGLRRKGWLLTPEEASQPEILGDIKSIRPAYRHLPATTLDNILRDTNQRERRIGLTDTYWPGTSGDVHAPLAMALARIAKRRDEADVTAALSKSESLALLNSPAELERVSTLLKQSAPNETTDQMTDMIVGETLK
ncbi:UNVERIFIED_CONTAM: hypothetical protein GTU68_041832 [Idotea baltica]|nr:hypothetical protein [Idotea baltica]